MFLRSTALALAISGFGLDAAQATTICTMVADAKSNHVLSQEGDCDTRVTPASTFKIAISLMGFDAGFLKDEHAPVLSYQAGDPDWGGKPWLEPTDPARWIQYSVVWYSQRVTHALGEAKVRRYAEAFDYGNADISGDPRKNNGLDRSWISSSLKISPREQITFLKKLVNRQLPVNAHAYDMTGKIAQLAQRPDGWDIHGKTGAAYPRTASGSFDESRGYGWFVGWATKGEQTLVFARLIQDEKKHTLSPGLRTRDAWLEQWPQLVNSLVK